MSELATFIASGWGISTFIALLTLWAVWSGLALWHASSRLYAELRKATTNIWQADTAHAFAARYEAIAQDLANSHILGPRWEAYKGSFLVSERALVHSTSPAADWFTIDLLRAPGVNIDPRYHAALPGLLVGAGLLLTFLGLTFALGSAGGIVAENVTQVQRNAALHDLLNAASFKFLTSIAGLTLSIGYALIRKHQIVRLERALDAFHAALDERIPLITPVQLQASTNELLQSQIGTLQAFTNELAINLAGAVDNAFDKRLGEHIGPLSAAMQQLSQTMSARNEEAMQAMLSAFLEKLQGGAGDQMTGVAEKLEALGSGLAGVQDGMRETAARMAAAADEMARRMGEGAEVAMERVTNQMSLLVETLRALAHESRTAGADAGRELAERLDAATGGFERSAQSVASSLTNAAQSLEQRMGSQAEDSARRLADQFAGMIQTLRELADNSRSMGATALDAVSARIDVAATSFQTVAERVTAALEAAAQQTGGAFDRGASEAVQRIVAATEGMRTELQAMVAGLRHAVGEAGAAMTEGGRAGAHAMRETLDRAGTDLAEAVGGAAAALHSAGETASSALRQGGEAAGSRLDTAGAGVAGQAAALGRRVNGLADGVALLATQVGELNRATGAAAQPLIEVTENLRRVADGARGATAPLAEVATRAAGVIEQVAATAQRLEASQTGAIRLAESLERAAARFEGVDRNLAKVMNDLQDGTRRFATDIVKFVTETDSNLSKAAMQISSMVKGLDDSIQNLTDGCPMHTPDNHRPRSLQKRA